MRNNQKFRELLLPKIQTVLTQRRHLQLPNKEKQINKELLDQYWSIKFELPSARLQRNRYSFDQSDGSVTLKGSKVNIAAAKNKENISKKQNIQHCMPTRYLLNKEPDFDEIFVKRAQINDWSRKNACLQISENQERPRKMPSFRISTSHKTEEVKASKKEQLSGWEMSEDNIIERIIMQQQ